ncbi:MAG: hypothetical protein ACFFA0_13675 [Promethearchaeota archaeon]
MEFFTILNSRESSLKSNLKEVGLWILVLGMFIFIVCCIISGIVYTFLVFDAAYTGYYAEEAEEFDLLMMRFFII